MQNKNLMNRFNVSAHVLILLLCAAPFAILAQQYTGLPVTKNRLLNVLRSKSLQTREIVKVVSNNGVDFQINPPVEAELVAAGARPEIIAAVRSNYRAPAVIKSTPVSTGKSKFTGTPLGIEAITTLLENGVTDAQVRKNVQARGVNFKPTPQHKTIIKTAGGSIALINLITGSYVEPGAGSGRASNGTGNNSSGGEDYDALVDKAMSQYDSKDSTGAIGTLQQALKLDVNNARAYQLMGFAYLYGQKNFNEAEKYMREAVNRGGSAVFRVYHDHDGLFNDTCQGSLYVAKDAVRFESDNNIHTFQTEDVNIKQVKMNSIFKTFYKIKTGSFKIVLKSGETDSVKFSFAPLTDNALESKMIIRLIGKN